MRINVYLAPNAHIGNDQGNQGKNLMISSCGPSDLCRAAATRAYRELRRKGIMDMEAFDVAVRVFKHHHPEADPGEARFAVADWLVPEASGQTSLI